MGFWKEKLIHSMKHYTSLWNHLKMGILFKGRNMDEKINIEKEIHFPIVNVTFSLPEII